MFIVVWWWGWWTGKVFFFLSFYCVSVSSSFGNFVTSLSFFFYSFKCNGGERKGKRERGGSQTSLCGLGQRRNPNQKPVERNEGIF